MGRSSVEGWIRRAATHLVCVVKRVVHEPRDYARLPDGLVAQKDELVLGQWIGARHLRIAPPFASCLAADTESSAEGKSIKKLFRKQNSTVEA